MGTVQAWLLLCAFGIGGCQADLIFGVSDRGEDPVFYELVCLGGVVWCAWKLGNRWGPRASLRDVLREVAQGQDPGEAALEHVQQALVALTQLPEQSRKDEFFYEDVASNLETLVDAIRDSNTDVNVLTKLQVGYDRRGWRSSQKRLRGPRRNRYPHRLEDLEQRTEFLRDAPRMRARAETRCEKARHCLTGVRRAFGVMLGARRY
eukprot:NODE_16994_length_966_cov_5.764005.p1 GENE.NODE_16994_length_966_cov_5.764005~~NODE_16994_length_966_cov_5.764005.p1  ORF type:complete len:206 (+),score=1.12 NODE_16994_length_966_cov_5.764005:73-690(+)